MSLTVHLAFVKRSWPEAMHYVRETQIPWVWDGLGWDGVGGFNAFAASLH